MQFLNFTKAFTVLSLYTAALQDEAGRFVEFVKDEAGQFVEFARDEADRLKLVFEEQCDHAKETFDDFLDSTVLPNVKKFVDDVIRSRGRQWKPSATPSILLLPPPPPPPPPVPPGTRTTPLYVVSGTAVVEQTGYPLHHEYRPLLLPPPAAARKATDKDTFKSHLFQSVKPSPSYGSIALLLLVLFTFLFGWSQAASVANRRPRKRSKSKYRKSKSRSRSRLVLKSDGMTCTSTHFSPLLDFVYMQAAITIHRDLLVYTDQSVCELSRGFLYFEPEYVSEGDIPMHDSSKQSDMDRNSMQSFAESSGSTSVDSYEPVTTPEKVNAVLAPAVHQTSATDQGPSSSTIRGYPALPSDFFGKDTFFEIDPASIPLPEPADDEFDIGLHQVTVQEPAAIHAPSEAFAIAPNVGEASALPLATNAGTCLPSTSQLSDTADDTGVPGPMSAPRSDEVDPCLIPLPEDDSGLEVSPDSDTLGISLPSGSTLESRPQPVEYSSSCLFLLQRVDSNDDVEALRKNLYDTDPASVPLPGPDEDEQAFLSFGSSYTVTEPDFNGSSASSEANVESTAEAMASSPANTTVVMTPGSLSFSNSFSVTTMQEGKVHGNGQEVQPTAIRLDPAMIPLPEDDSGLVLEPAAQSVLATGANDAALATEAAIPEVEPEPALRTSLCQITPLPLPVAFLGIDPASVPLPEALDDELDDNTLDSSHPYAIADCDEATGPLETAVMSNETDTPAALRAAEISCDIKWSVMLEGATESEGTVPPAKPLGLGLSPQLVPLPLTGQPVTSFRSAIGGSQEFSSKGECCEIDPVNVPLPEAPEDELDTGILDSPHLPASWDCDGTNDSSGTSATPEEGSNTTGRITALSVAQNSAGQTDIESGPQIARSTVRFEIDPADVPLPDVSEDEFETGICDPELLCTAPSCDVQAENLNALAPDGRKGIGESLGETGQLLLATGHLGPLAENALPDLDPCFIPLPGSDSDIEISNGTGDKEPSPTPGFNTVDVPEHPATPNVGILCAVTGQLPQTIAQETRIRMFESDISSVEDNVGIPREVPESMPKAKMITLDEDDQPSNSKGSSVAMDIEHDVTDADAPANEASDNNERTALPIDNAANLCGDGRTTASLGLDAQSDPVREEPENSLGMEVTPWASRREVEKDHITSRGTSASIWAPHAHDTVEQSFKEKDGSLGNTSQKILRDPPKSSLNVGSVRDLGGKAHSRKRREKVDSSEQRKGSRDGTRTHFRSSSTPDSLRNTTDEASVLTSSSRSPRMGTASERAESRLSDYGGRLSSTGTQGAARRAGSRPSTPQYEPFRFGSFSRRGPYQRHGVQESTPARLSHRSTCAACLSKNCRSTHEPADSDSVNT